LKNNNYILNRHNLELGEVNRETGNSILTYQHNTNAPIFVTVYDTFWILSVGQKVIYNFSSTFSEVFQQHCPQLFAQLLQDIVVSQIPVTPLNANGEIGLF
jgi:hypothetical protein